VLKYIGITIMIVIFAILILSPVLTLLLDQPTLAVTIRSYSMAPLMTRGDMVFILPVAEGSNLTSGAIIVYRAQEEGVRDWTMHRIVGGDAESGFITKGDANERPDQESPRYPPIETEWVKGVVPTLGNVPFKIPLIGHLPLMLEENMDSPVLIPSFLGILAVILVIDEVTKSKKRQRKEAMQKHHLYFIGAAAFAVMMGAIMLIGSLFITFPYGVDKNPGAITGSEIGVLELGTSREIELAELQNLGGIPSYYLVVSNDPQVELTNSDFSLRDGEKHEVLATVHAREEGIHQANVTIGMFLPFLPPGAIKMLGGISIWLAFAVTAIVPALPMFCVPFFDSRFRKVYVKKWRKKKDKISSVFG